MKIATWNVNSIRARVEAVLAFLANQQPDVLCMQETKVVDEDFPREPFEQAGYECAFSGEKSYNGVAILSRLPMKNVRPGGLDARGGRREAGHGFEPSRFIVATVGGVPLVNTYVPQGREPDSEHFRYKLDWFQRLLSFFDRNFTPRRRLIWVGDLNVAPEDRDVYDPKRLRGHVCFHPDAQAALQRVVAWGFVDCFRLHDDRDGQYTYYDYRMTTALETNRGWRVDHIMATRPLAKKCTAAHIDLTPRLGKKPSDHTPLIAEFDL